MPAQKLATENILSIQTQENGGADISTPNETSPATLENKTEAIVTTSWTNNSKLSRLCKLQFYTVIDNK